MLCNCSPRNERRLCTTGRVCAGRPSRVIDCLAAGVGTGKRDELAFCGGRCKGKKWADWVWGYTRSRRVGLMGMGVQRDGNSGLGEVLDFLLLLKRIWMPCTEVDT